MTNVQSDTGVLAGDERMLIDGELRHTDSGATFDVIHPASEEVAGQATDGTVADMDRAVGAARRAFDETDWSRDLDFRYHCMTQLHDALERNKERLRRVLITEVGCPVTVSGSQIESPIEEVKHWAEHARNFEYLVDTGIHDTPMGPARRKIHYEPIGVVGAITPWNVPFYLNIAETVPALMAGNTVVLKPAQLTPWSGSEYGRIVAEETDIPAGVFNVVVSNANEVGAALSADPRVDMITFTGSTATGRAILAAGAPTVKKTLLELGGKSAHIVLDDADFNSALPLAAMMACVMSGQSCILPSRILLPRSRYDEGIEILKTMMEGFPVGDPWTPGNMQGPQISATQREKVLGLIRSGIDSGARLVTGGGIPENLPTGYYVSPTLLADVDPDAQVAQEEIFGPVLTVTPYDTEDEAVAIANNSIYGLSGEVSSGDVDRALAVAKRMRTGNVTINGKSHFGITSPFGGTKQSGLGRRNGDEGYREYLEGKTIGLPRMTNEIAALLYRYARAVDTKDWELYRSVFTDDAYIDYSSAGAMAGTRDEVAHWLSTGFGAIPMSMHYISNIEVLDHDGDTARVRAMFYNPMQLPGMTELSYCGGYYHHEMVRTADGWRSRSLREESIWFVNGPVGRPSPNSTPHAGRHPQPHAETAVRS